MDENKMPLLSVIVPAYNCEEYIEECLDSVLGQLPEDYELIVVDDGSDDTTADILKKYDGTRDNVRIFYNEHRGASGARNRGIKSAKGEYIAFLDCDDCMRDQFLIKSRDLLEERAGLYIFGIEKISHSGDSELWTVQDRKFDSVSDFADEYIRSRQLLVYSICNKFYRRSVIEESELLFDETVTYGEDRLFNYSYLTLLGQEEKVLPVITSSIIMLKYIRRSMGAITARHVPNFFRQVMELHEAKMHCFLELSHGTTDEERWDFEAYDICRAIDKTIERFERHPEEKEENLPRINKLAFGGPYDINAPVDVIIILGSNNCGYKVDAALDIGSRNPGVKYIVSGANIHKSGECTEAKFMHDYLRDHGVDESSIYLENRAKYTKQNFEFSSGIIRELQMNGELPGKEKPESTQEDRKLRVGMVTGGFHIPRSRLIAEHMQALKEWDVKWFPAYGPSTNINSWFEKPNGRAIVLDELRKTLNLMPQIQEE